MHARKKKLALPALIMVAIGAHVACSSAPVEPLASVEQKITYGDNVYVGNSGSSKFQSEQSLVLVQQGNSRRLIAAYNDQNGATGIGWSLSTDASSTAIMWTPQGLMPPEVGSDMTAITGDPWLVSDAATRKKVFLTGLGHVGPADPGGNDVLAIAHSNNGASTWQRNGGGGWQNGFAHVPTPNCLPPNNVDKPSVDVTDDGATLTVAFVCVKPTTPWEIRAIKGAVSGQGAITWGSDALVRTLVQPLEGNPSPIVKGIYIVYANEGTVTQRHIEISVNLGGDNWGWGGVAVDEPTADIDFKGMGVTGMNPPTPDEFSALYSKIRNEVHFSFELARTSLRPCDILYDVNGHLKIALGNANFNWITGTAPVADQPDLKQFQGMLRWMNGNTADGTLAIAYYQQDWVLSPPQDRWTAVKGKTSTDGAITWTASNDQLSKMGGAFVTNAFTPCGQPTNPADWTQPYYFGDYIGLTPMITYGESNDILKKRFYAAWADQRPSCLQFLPYANHQHTVGELFGLP